MGVLPGILGSIQAAEVIKLIIGGAQALQGRLLTLNAWNMRFHELKLEKDPACPLCGTAPSIRELVDYEEFCGLKQNEEEVESISAAELKARIDQGEPLQIIDIREPHERSMSAFAQAKAIPFGQLARRMHEFDPRMDAIFICKVGQRSIYAIRALRDAGYAGRMCNLKDGLNAWARDVDNSLAQY
jgi:adenylyltransferase/sulfurtransferase